MRIKRIYCTGALEGFDYRKTITDADASLEYNEQMKAVLVGGRILVPLTAIKEIHVEKEPVKGPAVRNK